MLDKWVNDYPMVCVWGAEYTVFREKNIWITFWNTEPDWGRGVKHSRENSKNLMAG